MSQGLGHRNFTKQADTSKLPSTCQCVLLFHKLGQKLCSWLELLGQLGTRQIPAGVSQDVEVLPTFDARLGAL